MYSPNIPRCQHIKVNGTQCGSPAVRRNRFCFFHKRWHEQHIVIATALSQQIQPCLDVPVLEDANSVQVALMQVIQLLLAGQIEHKTAALVLYGLQTAASNIRHANFEQIRKESIVIDPETVDQTLLGDNLWNNADFDNEDDEEEDDEEQEEPVLTAFLNLPELTGEKKNLSNCED